MYGPRQWRCRSKLKASGKRNERRARVLVTMQFSPCPLSAGPPDESPVARTILPSREGHVFTYPLACWSQRRCGPQSGRHQTPVQKHLTTKMRAAATHAVFELRIVHSPPAKALTSAHHRPKLNRPLKVPKALPESLRPRLLCPGSRSRYILRLLPGWGPPNPEGPPPLSLLPAASVEGAERCSLQVRPRTLCRSNFNSVKQGCLRYSSHSSSPSVS